MTIAIPLNVLDIYLDAENPRHDPKEDQAAIIDFLVKGERVKQLGRDIAFNGTSPIDLIAVIQDDKGYYIVIEGNRRLCALTLLNDPAKHTPSYDYFKKLADNSTNIPSIVNCIVFDQREDADVWIERKHEGEQDGIGTRSWSPEGKLRHNSRKKKKDQNALANGLIEYAIKHGMLGEGHGSRLLTTAARYLGNPFFRKTLGITSSRSDEDIQINVSYREFNSALRVFIDDLLKNKTVNSRTNKSDWESYASSLIRQRVAPLLLETNTTLKLSEFDGETEKYNQSPPDQPNTPIQNGQNNGNDSGSQNANIGSNDTGNQNQSSGNTGTRHNRHPDQRPYIVPPDFRVHINDKILKRTFEEMRSIKIDDAPLAISLICRVFLESLYGLFHEQVAGHRIKAKTHVVMQKSLELIEKDNAITVQEKNALAALRRVQSNENNVLSPKTLGANAHAGIYPNATELKREWDNISEILRYMLKRI